MAETAITLRNEGYSITKPGELIELAEVLRAHIKKQALFTMISGKAYPHVEAWQFAGSCIGLFPVLESLDKESTEPGVHRYRATVKLIDLNGIERGRGIAICSNEESRKKSFDEYAVASMAQTRATGKAFRLCIGWVLKTAGYEATSAEEMEDWNQYGDVPLEDLKLPFKPHTELSKMEYEDIAHAISWASAKTRKPFHGWALRAEEYLQMYHETAGGTK